MSNDKNTGHVSVWPVGDADLRKAVLGSLPSGVFDSAPAELFRIIPHILVILFGFSVVLYSDSGIASSALASFLIGHSYACLAFLSHDVAHGSVVRGRSLRYLIEFVLWLPLLMPPTLWRVLHNRTHHRFFNTERDCDRVFLCSDESLPAKFAYMKLFSPLRGSLGVWNPLWLLHFPTYVIRNVLALGCCFRLPIVASVPDVIRIERMYIVGEFLVYAGLHALLLFFVWRGWGTVIFLEVIPIIFASVILMLFIFTNHLTQPILSNPNAAASTLSLRIPKIINLLYSNFGNHFEHHLFPSMPSRNYPLVARKIKEILGDFYPEVSFIAAWRKLLRSPFIRPRDEPIEWEKLVGSSGKGFSPAASSVSDPSIPPVSSS